MEWKPIETAPKDVRDVYNSPMPRECYVLLAFTTEKSSAYSLPICVGYWDAYYAPGGAEYYDGCSPWVIHPCGETTDNHFGEPTHWMPLPPQPTEK